MGILVGLEKVSHEWPAGAVLSQATCGIYEGDRIGIVGLNGTGKSTLLSIIAKQLTPYSGTITWRNSIAVGLLAQSDTLEDSATVLQALLGDTPTYIWASDPRIREVIDALLNDIDLETTLDALSGGQRRRVDLARVLIGSWDVLLLDEPTNHLDMSAIRWLASYLKRRWPTGNGALLVITHDRWFLDEVCEAMWELHEGRIEPFEGGYSAYIQQRVERQREAQVKELRRQNALRKELNWLAHGAKARTSKPKFRIDAARALLAEDPPIRNTLELKRLAVARLGKQVIELRNVSFSYQPSHATVLSDISWLVGAGERIGILGENGAGKTTLLQIMAGRLRPSSGFVKIGKTVHLAIMSQRLDELAKHDDERLEEVLASYKQNLTVEGKPQTPLQMAEHLGFTRRDLSTRLSALSGGQRRRLALLTTLLDQPNVLILDEPGNDLDTDMLTVIEDLLDSWPGTLLLVTHDQYLMERVTDDQYALIDGKLRHCPGGVDEYLQLLDKRGKLSSETNLTTDAMTAPQASSNQQAPTATSGIPTSSDVFTPSSRSEEALSSGGLTNKERRSTKKRLDAVERRLSKVRDELASAEQELTSCDPTDFERLVEIQEHSNALRSEADELEDEWLTLSELLG